MSQKGPHTWDMVIDYLECPNCGRILENRQSYEYHSGQYVKHVKCDYCGNSFTVTKDKNSAFGPLLGDPQPIEVDWEE